MICQDGLHYTRTWMTAVYFHDRMQFRFSFVTIADAGCRSTFSVVSVQQAFCQALSTPHGRTNQGFDSARSHLDSDQALEYNK
ncbi:hypothetical protein VTI28DRAFT_1817 [Corynascus sepedonium]